MRLRNNPHAIEELKASKLLIEGYPHRIRHDTVIEIGMGKGEMITKLAKKNPKIKYIGIEKYATVAAKAAKRAKELEINNFKIICDDIAEMHDKLEGKVKTIWLTFSDPWPKARHEKRRLTHKKFLQIYWDMLSNDGIIRFKTDNDKLFEYSIESMKAFGFKLKNVTTNFHAHESCKDNVMTGYEHKWSSVGKNINYLEAHKK